jgi:putative ABC transport system ATP-binding protein
MVFSVELANVTKSFPTPAGPVPAVLGATTRFMAGEITAIRGPSGSGKSTLLALVAGLERPTDGQVLAEGKDITRGNLDIYRRRRVGFVFQSYNLLPQHTSSENVTLPAELEGRRGSELTRRALALLADVGLDSCQAGRRPSRLSGGEQQRVAIARALMNDPPLVLADEPTGNLDEAVGRSIVDLLCRLARERGKCVIVVTHNPAVADRCDRVLVMKGGRIQGT